MLPPTFIDYILTRRLAEGVLLTGCSEGECYYRFGIEWTEARLAGERNPKLRERVPRERIANAWVGKGSNRALQRALQDFQTSLSPYSDRLDSLEDGPPKAPRAYENAESDA